ncbi:hypothetical protein BSNK01_28900 [Bacillaceae bacterium]
MKRFSEMKEEELRRQLDELEREVRRLRAAGNTSELAIVERKYYLAKSYLIDPREIVPGETYCVEGERRLFRVDYLNGVMAWGRLEGSFEQTAYPIAMLAKPGSGKND